MDYSYYRNESGSVVPGRNLTFCHVFQFGLPWWCDGIIPSDWYGACGLSVDMVKKKVDRNLWFSGAGEEIDTHDCRGDNYSSASGAK